MKYDENVPYYCDEEVVIDRIEIKRHVKRGEAPMSMLMDKEMLHKLFTTVNNSSVILSKHVVRLVSTKTLKLYGRTTIMEVVSQSYLLRQGHLNDYNLHSQLVAGFFI